MAPKGHDDQSPSRESHDQVDGPLVDEAAPAAEATDFIGGGFGSPVADRVHSLLSPVVATTGAELIDVHFAGGTLRLAVDRDGGIGTDSLAEINRLVSPLLDQHDPVPGRYTLEVSSPGVERPLRRVEHFERAVGETIIVKTIPGIEPRRLRGRLGSIADGRLTIEADEIDGVSLTQPAAHEVELAEVSSARTHFEWGPTPKLGGKSKGGSKAKAAKGGKSGKSAKSAKNRKAKQSKKRAPGASQKSTTEEKRGPT